MRVLHFFKTYWPDTFGGIERTIHAIAKGVAKYSVESDVLSLSEKPGENSLKFDGHMAYKAKLDFEFASTGFSRTVFGRFHELSSKADIVHYHFPWPVMDVVHLVTHSNKPTLVTYHSDIVKQKILLQFYKPLMFRFLNSVDRIVATSPNYLMSSEVLRRFEGKTTVIPLGLDEADYPKADDTTRMRWRKRFPGRFFLFIGVLRYYKGIHILLEAAKRNGLSVVVVGSGPMEEELKQAAEQGAHNVHFVGALSDRDKVALLELCEALVFPSPLRSEAFGLSLVEAAMFGKSMISCEIGTGTSFVNLNNETGLVIPPNDVDALTDAMQRIWRDKEKTVAMGSAARERYMEHFTAEIMCSAYYRLYREMANN
ncbi:MULTISPECIES: glycosyltransferase family 4 protein [unclassified Rhizobium]|uniref:glycosyltransferase family 4 protein n=1 Tax=unclassified Rhizobium TaxID=2613769 RepID=UPI000EA83FC3|nr:MULTISPECIES: glycosyltransferase family 4 protein [unclassified Rhizobium]AYG67907.1 glycosyltransferase [Rhizobium sp. CCGE531]AYG74297.1 glycosyltransferase [Rhizobium sp. CCGE532]